MRILLVQPAPFEPRRLGLENACWLSEPVALTSLAAMVPEHEVKILDMRLEKDGVFNLSKAWGRGTPHFQRFIKDAWKSTRSQRRVSAS